MNELFLGRPKRGYIMNHKKMKGLLLIALMAVSGLAGCLGTDDDEDDDTASTMDAADGGYNYDSDVDHH